MRGLHDTDGFLINITHPFLVITSTRPAIEQYFAGLEKELVLIHVGHGIAVSWIDPSPDHLLIGNACGMITLGNGGRGGLYFRNFIADKRIGNDLCLFIPLLGLGY